VSFCLVQVLRYAIGGRLPDGEGHEPNHVFHSNREAMSLIGVGLLLALFETIRLLYLHVSIPRLTAQLKNIIGMTFSWCLFFGMDWAMSANIFREEQGMMKEVSLALAVTVVALLMIFILEHVESFEHGGGSENHQEVVRAIVNSIGILIGFAWEKAFDTAVAEVAEETQRYIPMAWTKLLLAVGLAGMVVPAWKRHILPTIIRFDEEEEEAHMHGTNGEHGEHGKHHEGNAAELHEPLLTQEGGHGDGSVEYLRQAIDAMQRKAAELEARAQRRAELERKNAELNAQMSGIDKEIEDLEGLASLLARE